MYNQNRIYPYRRNTEIVKAFFAKPLTLVIAIAYALYAFLNLLINMFSVKGSVNIRFYFISIMMSVAFFLLYFQSRSTKPDVSYKAPAVLMKINAIISIVLMGSLLLCILFCGFVLLASPMLLSFMSTMPTILGCSFAIVIPLIAIGLTNAISLIIFSSSIRKSVSTVYLHNKGAGSFGVTSFLLVGLTVVSFIITTLFLPSMLSELADLFKNYAEQFSSLGVNTNPYIAFQKAFNNAEVSLNFQTIITNAMSIIISVLLGVFALKYKSYIKNQTNTINTGFDGQNMQGGSTVQTENYSPNPANGFIPQQPSFDQSNNPYMQNSQGFQNQPHQPDYFMPPQGNPYQPPQQNPHQPPQQNPYQTEQGICPVCGSECIPGAVFCGKCGAKLK